jgi:hypothetical protein
LKFKQISCVSIEVGARPGSESGSTSKFIVGSVSASKRCRSTLLKDLELRRFQIPDEAVEEGGREGVELLYTTEDSGCFSLRSLLQQAGLAA